MTYRAWICETCGRGQKFRDNVWNCPGCGKEGCDDCFERYASCKACAEGKSDEELRQMANKNGFSFEAECLVCGNFTEGFDESGPLCMDCAVVKALKNEG